MDYIQQISDEYNITKQRAKDLFIENKTDVWMDRNTLAKKLNRRAKSIYRILSNLNLFDLSNKRSTSKAIIRDYTRFAISRNGNLIEIYNIKTVSSLFLARKLSTKKKRLARKNRRTII